MNIEDISTPPKSAKQCSFALQIDGEELQWIVDALGAQAYGYTLFSELHDFVSDHPVLMRRSGRAS